MINVIIVNKDLYRYEIHSLFKAFYPEQEIRVVVEGDAHGERILEKNPFLMAKINFLPEKIELLLASQAKPAAVEAPGRLQPERTQPATIDPERLQPETTETAATAATAGTSEAPETVHAQAAFATPWHMYQTCRPEGSKVSFQEKGKELKDTLKTFLYESLSDFTNQQLPWGDLIGIRPTKICTTLMENSSTQEEAVRFMEKAHHVSHEKAVLAGDIAAREMRILAPIHYDGGFSLYIGIPFCPTTCLYCSFPSFNVSLWKDRVDDYLTALIREIQATARLMQGQILDTIYIGGGTPTTLQPAQLQRLISAIEKNFDTSQLLEFTVEAGRPDSITREKLEVMQAHEVSRISVNPQTMNEETLHVIGRCHTVQQTIDAYYLARECGFDNINMDIILGLPGEGVQEVEHTMEEIAKLSPDDLTVHSLAIKRASRLRRIIDEKGYPVLMNTDETMRIAADGATRMDMKPYYLYRQKNMSGNFENTGYAREGKYGIYNILIMEEKQSILALGAGSISKIVMHNPDDPQQTRIERADHPKDVATYIDHIDEMIERESRLFRVQ